MTTTKVKSQGWIRTGPRQDGLYARSKTALDLKAGISFLTRADERMMAIKLVLDWKM